MIIHLFCHDSSPFSMFFFFKFSFHSNSLLGTLVWKNLAGQSHTWNAPRTFVEVHPNWRRTSLQGSLSLEKSWMGVNWRDSPVVLVNTTFLGALSSNEWISFRLVICWLQGGDCSLPSQSSQARNVRPQNELQRYCSSWICGNSWTLQKEHSPLAHEN